MLFHSYPSRSSWVGPAACVCTHPCTQVLRDLILSFSLPSEVVGTRRAPLLSRESNAVATERFTSLLGAAHEAAMRGAEWSWRHDDNQLHKVSALLAGLCILMAGRAEGADHIRKSDAFRGRVQLPFLQTEAAATGQRVMALLPHTHTWLVYSMDKRGRPKVELRCDGFEGLCKCVLLLTQQTRAH